MVPSNRVYGQFSSHFVFLSRATITQLTRAALACHSLFRGTISSRMEERYSMRPSRQVSSLLRTLSTQETKCALPVLTQKWCVIQTCFWHRVQYSTCAAQRRKCLSPIKVLGGTHSNIYEGEEQEGVAQSKFEATLQRFALEQGKNSPWRPSQISRPAGKRRHEGGSKPRRIFVTRVTGPTLHAAMLLPCA